MDSISIFEPVEQHSFWYAFNSIHERSKSITDHRIPGNPNYFSDLPMTDSDVSLCKFPEPRFGDFNELWHRVETYLQNEGFGTLRDNFDSWRA
jgi:hypothetical protein